MGIAKIAFDPPLCQMGTLGHLFGLYFFFSYGRHDIRNENIRSAFFNNVQWVLNFTFSGRHPYFFHFQGALKFHVLRCNWIGIFTILQ